MESYLLDLIMGFFCLMFYGFLKGMVEIISLLRELVQILKKEGK